MKEGKRKKPGHTPSPISWGKARVVAGKKTEKERTGPHLRANQPHRHAAEHCGPDAGVEHGGLNAGVGSDQQDGVGGVDA